MNEYYETLVSSQLIQSSEFIVETQEIIKIVLLFLKDSHIPLTSTGIHI